MVCEIWGEGFFAQNLLEYTAEFARCHDGFHIISSGA